MTEVNADVLQYSSTNKPPIPDRRPLKEMQQ